MTAARRPAVFREVADGVTVTVRVAPRSGRNRIEGVVAEADGAAALKIAVTAAPEDGQANDAVIAVLAKAWRIPRSSFHIRQGAAARRKVLHVAGDSRTLVERLSATLPERDN